MSSSTAFCRVGETAAQCCQTAQDGVGRSVQHSYYLSQHPPVAHLL